jgi:type VI secretion system protein ImpA
MSSSVHDLMAGPFTQELLSSFEPLLAPISPARPTGESLRYDPLYDQIQMARRTEDDALPQGVWQRATQQADWNLVEQLTTEAIAYRSKDLQLAIWRTEALLHLHGLPGFVAGCQLIFGMHVSFPSTMHPTTETSEGAGTLKDVELPLPEDDSALEHRINLIQWMNEKLAVQLKLLPITSPRAITDAAAYSLADLESARLLEQSDQRKGGSVKEQRIKLFETSLVMTPIEWLVERWSELQNAAAITGRLDELLDCIYGEANSGLLQIKHVLDGMATAIASVLPREELSPAVHEGLADGEAAAQDNPSPVRKEQAANREHDFKSFSPSAASTQPIRFQVRTREEAYLQLSEIAALLAELEPHSPVPYLLRRAIVWGGMSLEELLPELLADGTVLRDVGTLLRLSGGNRSYTK